MKYIATVSAVAVVRVVVASRQPFPRIASHPQHLPANNPFPAHLLIYSSTHLLIYSSQTDLHVNDMSRKWFSASTPPVFASPRSRR
jgi:cytochrome b561